MSPQVIHVKHGNLASLGFEWRIDNGVLGTSS
jgi:hypothetical protein